MTERLSLALSRARGFDHAICLALNRTAVGRGQAFFGAVGWLGNGLFWVLTAVLLFLWAPGAWRLAVSQLVVSGISATLIYTVIKRLTARARPCDAGIGIRLVGRPLDRYSFPSGHTLHAVSFTIIVAHHALALLVIVLPFALLVALSRVVLGHHYPTDVAASALLGSALAMAIINLVPAF